jgi:hypothetical protein
MAIHTTTASWRKELEVRKAQTRSSFAVVVKNTAARYFRKIIFRTPILTGRASGSWAVSFGSPEDADIGPGLHGDIRSSVYAEIVTSLNENVSSRNPFRKIYLNNTVPYINLLERGSSTQAPAGMVRVSAAEIRAELGSRMS